MPIPRRGRVRSSSSSGEEADSSRLAKKERGMDKLKYVAQRAMVLLGSVAAFAVVIDGAKRWP
jgi:hypothetical protein